MANEVKILDQDVSNAVLIDAVKQLKDYIDAQRNDIPVTATSAASYAVPVKTAAEALQYAESDLVTYVDDVNTVLYNPWTFYRAQKLTTVRFTKVENFAIDTYSSNYTLSSCPMLVSVIFDKLDHITNTNTDSTRADVMMLRADPNLQTVILPELQSISVSNSANYVSSHLQFLYSCPSLVTVNLPKLKTISCTTSGTGIGAKATYLYFLYNSSVSGSIDFSSLQTVSASTSATGAGYNVCNYFMRNCTEIEHMSFPALTTITTAGNTSSLTSAVYPVLYDYFMAGCTDLKSVEFPVLTTLGHTFATGTCSNGILPQVHNYFLQGCTSLESVSFPNLVSITHAANATSGSGGPKIYNNFMRGCTSLTSITFPKLTTVSAQCTGAGTGNVSQCYMLQGCTSLVTASFPQLRVLSVTTSAGSRIMAFLNGCTSLETVQIGTETANSITALAAGVAASAITSFADCPNLIDIEIGNHLTDQPVSGAVQGPKLSQNLTLLCKWYPTNVLADATKCAQWNANIRNHIAANCVSGSYTITFNTALNGTGYLEQETIDAFTSLGWTVAYA